MPGTTVAWFLSFSKTKDVQLQWAIPLCTESRCRCFSFMCTHAAPCNICLPNQVRETPDWFYMSHPIWQPPSFMALLGEAASLWHRVQCLRLHFWHCQMIRLLLSLLLSYHKFLCCFSSYFQANSLCQKSCLWFLSYCLIQLVVILLFSIITLGFLSTWDFSVQFSEFHSHTHLKLHPFLIRYYYPCHFTKR